MSIFSNMLAGRKREKDIQKKMKVIEHSRTIAHEADKLHTEFGLSADDARFMAERNLSKQKRQKTISDISSGIAGVASALDVGEAPQAKPSKKSVDQAKRKNSKKKNEGKKGKGSGKKFDPLKIDIPDLKF